MNNNYHSRISEILDARFVKYDAVAHALATALASGKNILLHGPGGHAKSEMVEAALKGLGLWDTTFLESFGEGLTEDTLWGGINLDAMSRPTGAKIEFHPENSFLAAETAVFEEMLDSPSPVLLSLKDTLTRRELRKGNQRYPMRTRVIIACTNHDPSVYADSDDPADRARQALLERFPIQVKVAWDTYTSLDYLSMYRKHPLYDFSGNAEKIAEIVAEATTQGHFVSPRAAIHALEIVHANALDRGHSTITPEDMADIKCLAGLAHFGENLVEEIKQMSLVADAKRKFTDIRMQLAELLAEYATSGNKVAKFVSLAKRADKLKMDVLSITVAGDMISQRQTLADEVADFMNRAQSQAWAVTNI
jgi:hypothetical protein